MTTPETEPFRLLFVCTGNTCRSPLAEVIARRLVSERGWNHVEIGSAGVAAFDGAPASGGSVRTAEANGLDLSRHASKALAARTLSDADLILTMSASHLFRVFEMGAGDRAAVITSFAAGEEGEDVGGVPDPIGGPDEEYAETYRVLERLIEASLARLEPVLSP
ncbi:MAG: low molecular weight protein arginine phosphatase [Gemmatimonadota bacterium]